MPQFDLFDPEFLDDPWPTYRLLRNEAPAFYVEDLGVWLVTRYDTVLSATTDTRTWSNAKGNAFPRDIPERMGNTLGATDPPKHDRLRRLVMKAFTPRRVAAMEPVVRTRTKDLLSRLAGRDRFDFVGDFATDLTSSLVALILGVPEEDLPRVSRMVDESFTVVPDQPTAGLQPVFDYLAGLVEQRTREPLDDVISGLVQAEVEGRRLDQHEVVVTAGTIMAAGYASTVHALGNMFVALAKNPDARREIREDPSLAAAAFEESLRYDAAAHIFGRTTLVPIEVHGRVIPEGARVGLCYGSANRDERAYPEPDRFWVGRPLDSRHLGFGMGPHFCLGSPLARLEARVLLEESLPVLGDYSVDVGPAQRLRTPAFHGYTSIPTQVSTS
ncbi:cytochrome P450 [Pseudonocardia asaccharolytica]|uniref:Cytochrome P450 monooxygenase n=1 Tax=Pseudonocardia asaccharolytica DSM 44247 = NBRC 16224 TaxID=1123024 RepID=A0A511D2W0_9PSEU|nr:cytochrome P450 [Pseudonocardia asaccharolytica]GEL17238.1 cytochrome P450 monooxygenase [Pseudonocardia asaccharolytica DSM 44247 = NBRC 16224]